MKIDFFTPRVSKHYLLFIAALVWTFAGGMLLFRGLTFLDSQPSHLFLKLFTGLLAGLLFFRLLFNRISAKHVLRIQNLPIGQPCLFSFFDIRSYLMMFSMITLGVMLRKSGFVSAENLSLIYIIMGIPLLMSSFRFYQTFFNS
ncbi:MAG TPA: hypothetical protein DCR40_05395 [Prolixibacteraceae bacterium]|nr:hypothetical protein [Prolixibacteraceae bacterium]